MRTLALSCALLFCRAQAQASPSGRAAAQLGDDARSEGLGGVSAVLDSGALSLQGNPAALTELENAEAAFTHQSWLADTHQEDLAWATPLGQGKALGLEAGWFGVPSFDSTGGVDPAVDASLLSLNAGLGLKAGWMRLGAGLGFSQQQMGSADLSDLSFNLGALASTPFEPLSFGVSLRQLGAWTNADAGLPGQAILGAALNFDRFLLEVDGQLPLYGANSSLHSGFEWHAYRLLSLRAGLSSDDSPDQSWAPSLGVGLVIGRLHLDLSTSARGALGNTSAATLRVDLGSAPAPAPTPTPSPSPVAAATAVPTPRPRAPGRPAAVKPDGDDGESRWDGGDFDLDAAVQGDQVLLNWPAMAKPAGAAKAYQVYISLVPEASMRLLGNGAQAENAWHGEMGMRGMTYYFRVKVLGPDGSVTAVSRIKSVIMP